MIGLIIQNNTNLNAIWMCWKVIERRWLCWQRSTDGRPISTQSVAATVTQQPIRDQQQQHTVCHSESAHPTQLHPPHSHPHTYTRHSCIVLRNLIVLFAALVYLVMHVIASLMLDQLWRHKGRIAAYLSVARRDSDRPRLPISVLTGLNVD